ncbi:MAG TPA: histidine decarboxylase, partial [Nitrosomonas sp.]|nr:histidine decarboxylase [Nitrosomonas sp.]
MFITRRKFLGLTGAATLIATCSPNALTGQTLPNELPDYAVSSDLKRLYALTRQRTSMLGYPINMNYPPAAFFDWRQKLDAAGLNKFSFNSVGDPFKHSHFFFNTHDFEKELIERFGAIYGFMHKQAWGFLTNSGTDSNMHGIYIGRTLLKSRTGITPKIYFTREAHYSIQILRNLMNLEWVVVDTQVDGSMDIHDLEQKLKANPNHPALIVATMGTTFKGAIDPIDDIQSKLKGREFYLHLDAALFGGYLPHTSFAGEVLHTRSPDQPARYHSIAVSCHKFFGFPSPAGLFITIQSIFDEFEAQFGKIHDPEYILQVPGTITCSRDSVKPAEFHFFSSEQDFSRQTIDAQNMMDNANYLLNEMKTHY